ncbi:MAG: hypothetical protein ACLSAF_09860 [Intestinimonas sp.]
MSGPGVRLPAECHPDHQCPLPQLPQKMELRSEGEKQLFACVCGYRERLSDFKKRHAHSAAGKRDVQRFLQNQREEKGTSAMAEQLKKWLEQQEK